MHTKILTLLILGMLVLVGCDNSSTNTIPDVVDADEELFQLGRRLFYDSRLSSDGTISCGSCHQQQAAFAHASHPVSHGVEDKNGIRNSLAIQNMALRTFFFWDGGVTDLELVPLNAISNPVEMNTNMNSIVAKLQSYPEYRKRFVAAFNSDSVTSTRVLKALAAFTKQLVSVRSRYDSVMAGQATFTTMEQQGSELFSRLCVQCHAGTQFATNEFKNNGFVPINGADYGRELITLNRADRNTFRVPSLRNAQFTAPYMHTGEIRTLRGAIEHYRTGIATNEFTDIQLRKPEYAALTNADIDALLAYIQTLSDRQFITDPRFSEVAP